MMLLKINNLSADFQTESGVKRLLNNVRLEIGPSETVALVGESGSGKSITALSILGLHEQDRVTCRGEVLFAGQNLLKLPEKALRRIRGNRIAMIFQEPMTSLNPVYPIGRQIIEPLMLHQGLNREQARAMAINLMAKTMIPDPESRMQSFAHQLSGGQRQRVMIAMALACRPDLLIADEPTTALDVTIQSQILELLAELQKEFKMAVLLITHDLNMVGRIAERVYIMNQGEIIEHGRTAAIFTNPGHPYTRHLLNSVPHGEAPIKDATEPLITIRDLKCYFPIRKGFFKRKIGEIRAVDGVNLTIYKGNTFGIVGESGSGKSTLGMCLLRLNNCHGLIDYQGRDLSAMTNRQMRPLRRELQVVFQDPFSSLSPRLTIARIIEEGLKIHNIGNNRGERLRLVRQSLIEVGLEADMAERYPHEFSGGQRQRIAIARAICLKPEFIVLDEPTSALDMTIQAQIIDLLKELQRKYNMTYLFISHDLHVVKTLANQVAVMKEGRIIESGPAHEIFSAPREEYTRTLLKCVSN